MEEAWSLWTGDQALFPNQPFRRPFFAAFLVAFLAFFFRFAMC